jgi:hypothetical protein
MEELDGFINFRKEEEGRRQSEMTSKVFDEDQQRSELIVMGGLRSNFVNITE